MDSDLKKVNINLEYDEIETLSPTLLKNMVKKKVNWGVVLLTARSILKAAMGMTLPAPYV